MSEDNDVFKEIMPAVAEQVLDEFLGPRNVGLSSNTEWRWGKKGSMVVDLIKGTWFYHEDQIGGGVIDLLKAFNGLDDEGATRWLVDRGFLQERSNEPPPEIEVPGGFPKWMEPKPVAVFEYRDDKGHLAYQVLKFPKTAQKRYMQRRPYAGNTWVWGLRAGHFGKSKKSKDYFKTKPDHVYDDEIHLEEAQRWLYRREEVIRQKKKGGIVFLAEGEKDVETLRAWGYVATTNAGGAKEWRDYFEEDLAGCDIIILPDNDDPGRDRAKIRAATLKGKAKRIRVLDISLHWKGAEPGNDVTDWKERTLGTRERFEELIKHAIEPEKPKSRFNAIHWRDISLAEVRDDYLIYKLLTMGDVSILAGESQAGKSFMGIHMGMCVARGLPWFGHAAVRGGVAYQAGEGGRGVQKRLIAYRDHFDVPENEDVPFFLLPSRVNLFSRDGDCEAFIEDLRIQSLELSEPLRLVVIDTLSKASAGAQENDGRDMSVIMNNVEKIRKATGAHVMIVHHMNAGGEKIRGHTSLKADVDQLLLITNDKETGIKTLKVDKLKDDDPGETLRFVLSRVVIAHDPVSGDEISSCVVTTVSEKEAISKEKEKEGFYVNAKERAFLVDFFAAKKLHGRYIEDQDPHFSSKMWGKTVVEWNDFVSVVQSKQMDRTEDEKGEKRSRDAIRKTFESVRPFLEKGGVMGFERPYLWWTGKAIRGFRETFPRKDKTVDPQAQTGMFDGYDDPDTQAYLDSMKDIPF